MGDRFFDLVVVGGGIQGAGAAQAAVARGHSVLVLERSAIASGTSGRSSKLIHGGLRYLETGQFRLVNECLRERALLLRLAPELVRLVPFHVPIYATTRRSPWQVRAGLSLYAALAAPGPAVRFRSLPRSAWNALDGLDTGGLRAVFRYWDAQTDDAALTRAVMGSAQELGAELLLPAQFLGATREGNRWRVHYAYDDRTYACEAMAIVNASGPWVNEVLATIVPQPVSLAIELVQGSHLVIDARLSQGAYYLEAPQDGRGIFVLPWKDKVLLGTTETPYAGDPAQVHPLAAERRYLLEALAHYFPALGAEGEAHVLDAFAGLRVLTAAEGTAFKRPRDTRLGLDRPRRPTLVTIYGGKLTAYRATAAAVMRRLAPTLPARRPRADTRALRLRPMDG